MGLMSSEMVVDTMQDSVPKSIPITDIFKNWIGSSMSLYPLKIDAIAMRNYEIESFEKGQSLEILRKRILIICVFIHSVKTKSKLNTFYKLLTLLSKMFLLKLCCG